MSDFGSTVMIGFAGYSLPVAILCCSSASCDFVCGLEVHMARVRCLKDCALPCFLDPGCWLPQYPAVARDMLPAFWSLTCQEDFGGYLRSAPVVLWRGSRRPKSVGSELAKTGTQDGKPRTKSERDLAEQKGRVSSGVSSLSTPRCLKSRSFAL